ncbi:hypothetical protein BGZ96_011264 [Linnemannia gamsii]|uniref:Arm-like repeat domain-containing protein n=1 Tax=Linnemannia gamsii TaxID=64522 RepID=A0ABQ7JTF6_9FUNG|nr:hypothetical protein BGZ96_011264 [Linnemannia gamsii]
MTKTTLSTPPSPPPQLASQQGEPNSGQDVNNQSVSVQPIRKRDRFSNMFQSSSSKLKATNFQSTSSKSTANGDSTVSADESAHRLSTVGGLDSVDIDHVVHSTAVKSIPSDTHAPSQLTRPRLDMFPQNVSAPAVCITLPKFGARIESTPQLALCIGLLSKADDTVNQQDSPYQEISLDTAAQLTWIKAMEQDTTEQERTRWLGTRMVDEFAKDVFKDSTEIAEMVHIGPVLDKEHFRGLLSCMIIAFDQSAILNVELLQGLVQLMQSSPPNSLVSDDLVKVLSLLRVRLQGTHQQCSAHPYYLMLAVSRLLDVMADRKVQDLNRVEEHEPLSGVLSGLKGSSDPFLLYQACYAFQALQYVPNDETVLQALLRHSVGVVDGLVKVTTVMKLDLSAVIEGLGELQKVLESTGDVAGAVYEGACTLMESGRGILDSLKEGYGSRKKRPWYAAIRAANVLARTGQLQDLNRLIGEAPCRRDPLFQWGICQLLGEIASDDIWDTVVRKQSIELIAELYKNDPEWAQDDSVKTWMRTIIGPLGTVVDEGASTTSQTLLMEPQQEQAASASVPYPLRNRLPHPIFSPILARVHNMPALEYDLHRLQALLLKQTHKTVYIPPMAKLNLKNRG